MVVYIFIILLLIYYYCFYICKLDKVKFYGILSMFIFSVFIWKFRNHFKAIQCTVKFILNSRLKQHWMDFTSSKQLYDPNISFQGKARDESRPIVSAALRLVTCHSMIHEPQHTTISFTCSVPSCTFNSIHLFPLLFLI